MFKSYCAIILLSAISFVESAMKIQMGTQHDFLTSSAICISFVIQNLCFFASFSNYLVFPSGLIYFQQGISGSSPLLSSENHPHSHAYTCLHKFICCCFVFFFFTCMFVVRLVSYIICLGILCRRHTYMQTMLSMNTKLKCALTGCTHCFKIVKIFFF